MLGTHTHRSQWKGYRLQVTSSRPYGTFRHSDPCPGLRPGLSSAVPTGLDFEIDSRAQTYGAAEAVPVVRQFLSSLSGSAKAGLAHASGGLNQRSGNPACVVGSEKGDNRGDVLR